MLDDAILTHHQLECLASPVRNDIFIRVRQMGLASAREVAAQLGKSGESIHYHLKQLEAAGLIREVARRPAPRKPESVYEPTARRLRLPGPEASVEDRRLARKAVVNGLRDVIRGFEAAGEAGEISDEVRSHISVIRANLRLSAGDLETFIAMIEAASRFAAEHREEDGLRVQWSSVVFPIVKTE